MTDNSDIMHFAPSSWARSYEVGEFPIHRGTPEFIGVENDLLKAIRNAKSVINLTRIQNVYDFGQFLMRSQIVAIAKQTPVYQVRRYVAIPKNLREIAKKHNLDHRRLNMSELTFKSHLDYMFDDKLIFVVQILTDDPHSRSVSPYNFTEYYIDYIAEMEYF